MPLQKCRLPGYLRSSAHSKNPVGVQSLGGEQLSRKTNLELCSLVTPWSMPPVQLMAYEVYAVIHHLIYRIADRGYAGGYAAVDDIVRIAAKDDKVKIPGNRLPVLTQAADGAGKNYSAQSRKWRSVGRRLLCQAARSCSRNRNHHQFLSLYDGDLGVRDTRFIISRREPKCPQAARISKCVPGHQADIFVPLCNKQVGDHGAAGYPVRSDGVVPGNRGGHYHVWHGDLDAF